jgi:GABA permease
MLFLYGMIGVAQIRYRSGLSQDQAARLQLKMWLFPALSYFTVVGIIAVLVAVGMIPDLRSQLTATTGFMIFLFGFYFLFRRGRYVAVEASQA